MKIYFAHPVTDYGTAREGRVEEWLKSDGWRVENPNLPHHQVGYAADGMAYFERLVATCDALVFVRFQNGAIGAGVGKEIDSARGSGMPVYEWFDGAMYSVYGMPTPILSVADTRALISAIREAT